MKVNDSKVIEISEKRILEDIGINLFEIKLILQEIRGYIRSIHEILCDKMLLEEEGDIDE